MAGGSNNTGNNTGTSWVARVTAKHPNLIKNSKTVGKVVGSVAILSAAAGAVYWAIDKMRENRIEKRENRIFREQQQAARAAGYLAEEGDVPASGSWEEYVASTPASSTRTR